MTQKSIIFLFLLTAIQHVHSQSTQYNIKDFGAVGDGVTICTGAINSAVEKCFENGGGMVVVPAGIFKTGTVVMKNNVQLHLEMGSTLLASTEYKDYPRQPQPEYRSLRDDPAGWYAVIYAEKASNIAITGFGTIDGNGASQKPALTVVRNAMNGRPLNILFISCKHVRVEGIKMLHSGMWNQHYLNCEDVMVDRIEAYNHSNNNNDAIDIDGCRRFVLSNSIFDSSDDGIVLKSTGPALTEDVTIMNCVISSFTNAIKTGTETIGGFRNISISNCVIKPSRSESIIYGSRRGITGISLIIVDGGVMEGVAVSNITIEGTECPLYIRLGNRAMKYNDTVPEPPVGKMRNITISNIAAYNTGNFCNSILGTPGGYIENIIMDNIQLFNNGGITGKKYYAVHQDVEEDEKGYPQPFMRGGQLSMPSSVFFIRHVKGLSINNLMFGSKQDDPRIPVIAVDVERFRLGKSIFSGVSLPPCFVFLASVKEFDIEKPLGWGENPLIKQ